MMRTLRPQPLGLDPETARRHRLRNALHSALLLGGMALILAACAWVLAGVEGLVWTLLGALFGIGLMPQASPRLVLAMYRARRIGPRELPEVFSVLRELCRRAGLPRGPALYYVPSATLNAFAVGSRDDAAVAVTDGMLRALSLRELAGVLAHELSHIRNNDLWVMNLADVVTRLTGFMSSFGLVLLLIGLPLMLTGAAGPAWLLLAMLLVFAPTLVSLLQLALSRAREYDADRMAAELTGDPAGLASALAKLERYQGRMWEDILLPGRRVPAPSLLRTHPPTEERVRRLMDLYGPEQGAPFPTPPERRHGLPMGFVAAVPGRPRWRATGVWY
jgi:heat shock protein HtpX